MFWEGTESGNELAFGLTQGDDGYFYGLSRKGGGSNRGAIFRVSPEGRHSALASFSNLKIQGAFPSGPLLKGSGGVFFGACEKGGSGGGGVLFEVTAAGVLSTIHSFDVKSEYAPKLLLRGLDGALYGTVRTRASRGTTMVFCRSAAGTISYWDVPGVEALTEGKDGRLYATARRNYWDNGTILKLAPGGEVAEIVTFNRENGAEPIGLVALPGDGGFLGITRRGGYTGMGVLFRLGYTGEFTLLHSFGSTRGHYLRSGLARGADGNFYGVMKEGGLYGRGTIFRLTSTGQLTVLHAFKGEDGASPNAALLAASDGALYGTTEAGGEDYEGTLFKITPEGQFTSLFSFSWKFGGSPAQALIEGGDGLLYGTTTYGGRHGQGGVYRLSLTGGAPQTVAHFPSGWGAGGDGCLAFGNDGNIYGLGQTQGYFSYGPAVFYRVTSAGELKVLRKLSAREGNSPSGLTLGPDGNFYGSCQVGGIPFWGSGTLFRITTAGQLKVLRSYSFMSFEEGSNPSQLTLGSDGNLYGTTQLGGSYGSGLVFRLTVAGEYKKLQSLAPGEASSSDSSEESVLTEGADGNLYGNHHFGFVYWLSKEPRENRSPNATEDLFFLGTKPSGLPVLENDWEPDGDQVEITGVTQGSRGTVEISNDKRSVVYHPSSNFTGLDHFSYELSDGKGGVGTANVTVRGWSELRATYSLPLRRKNGDVVGRLELRLSGNGVFTGKAFVLGRTISVRGKLKSSGSAVMNPTSRNGSPSMILYVEQTGDASNTLALRGHLSVVFESLDFGGGPVISAGALSGRYTVLMEIPEPHAAGPTLPRGMGWGVMTVEENGSVIAKGQLPDGTPFSSGGWFSSADRWTFCAAAGPKALAFGEVIFADIPQESDASATLMWSAGAKWRGIFPLGFETMALRLVASRYTLPATGSLPLAFSTQPAKADVILSEGEVMGDYTAELTFMDGSSGVLTGVNVETRLRIDAFGGAEGIWTGSFLHPQQLTQKRTFKGVVFQKRNQAEAIFTDRAQTGRVLLEPK